MNFDTKRKTANDGAVHWALKNSFEQLSEEDQIAFEEWLAQSADHVKAYEQACLMMEDLSALKELPEAALVRDTEKRDRPSSLGGKLREWFDASLKPITAGAAIAAAAAAFLIVQGVLLAPVEKYSTRLAEVREIQLQDGSRVTLGAKSEINVSFSQNSRHVTLVKGRAFFSVEKNQSRPFYVTAEKSVIKVVGTKFDVHLGQNREQISVLEGLVAVTPNQDIPHHETQSLGAGELLTVTKLLVQKSKAIQEPGEWRTGHFIYEDAPLIEVIGDVNRYYEGRIILESSRLNDLKITTSFSVRQIDKMLETLPHILPLKAEHKSDGRVYLHYEG
jgi:transmembrane sensor